MKTAIQKMIKIINDIESKTTDQEQIYMLTSLQISALILLEKEKEQIMNAYADGAKGGANGNKGQHDFGWVSIQIKEKYYNQTYNQNK